jgi:hypothetical protein
LGRLAAVAPSAPAAAGGEEAGTPASPIQPPQTTPGHFEEQTGGSNRNVDEASTEQQQALRSSSPGWPWVQDVFTHSSSSSSSTVHPAKSSSSAAPIKLPVPSFWELPAALDLPRQLAQLASRASAPTMPPATPEPPEGSSSSSSSSKAGSYVPRPQRLRRRISGRFMATLGM